MAQASVKVRLYTRGLAGHRAAYLEFASALLRGRRTGWAGMFVARPSVLFLMIEDSFALYLAVALWRSLLGRRTVGLLFRPGPAIDGQSLRLRAKRVSLRLLRHLPLVQTLSIMPVSLDLRMSMIVDGWIHDFQLWDMGKAHRTLYRSLRKARAAPPGDEAARLHARLRHVAAGRRLLAAIGAQNRHKGFDVFADQAPQGGQFWHFAAGGKLDGSCTEIATALAAAGGTVINRFLSDAEMLALYAASDAVWCHFAASYDQASGVLGRAVQFGLPVVVRAGSFSHRLCQQLGHAHLALEVPDDLRAGLHSLPAPDAAKGAALAAQMRRQSLARLCAALDIPQPVPAP